MARLLLIDNFDSFVFNVARYLRELGHSVRVVRNDDPRPFDDLLDGCNGLVISPGPCAPAQAGISNAIIRHAAGRIPILGICLGHQCIGEVFGAQVVRAREPMHGRSSEIYHDGEGLFAGLPSPLTVGRYHSLIVRSTAASEANLRITSRSPAGETMSLAHAQLPIFGVQFHPESVLTQAGHALLANFAAHAAVLA